MSAPSRPATDLAPRLVLLLLLAALLGACQAATSKHLEPEAADDTFWDTVHHEKLSARHQELARLTGGTLQRQEVLDFLDRGPAHLLGAVPVMPVLDTRDTLVGYRIEAFFPEDPALQRVDLLKGDVVTAINGVRIERPEHLFDLYQALRTAPRLQIDVMRDDTLRTLTWEIVDTAAVVGEN